VTQQWRPVVGYEGLYEVSNDGQVRSLDRWSPGGVVAVRKYPGRMMRLQTINGYQMVSLRRQAEAARLLRVHRLMLEAFVGAPPFDGAETRHLNGNRSDNRLANLQWGTTQENARDRTRHGTNMPGEENPKAKLQAADIPAIRELIADGRTLRSIAREYGVTHGAISAIKAGRNWDQV
jgi:hypothetical protein